MESYNEKSDILITLIGTSPMPNLISLATRLKKGGSVYLIFSKETEYICEKLKKKWNTNYITVKLEKINNVYNPKLVYENISDIFIKISKEDIKDKVIELNFTGGTKVMSSISYVQFIKYFRKKAKSVLTTYLDGEKFQMIIRDVNKNKDYINKFNSKDGIFPISIEDIGELHTKIEKVFECKHFESTVICPVNYALYENLFITLDDKRKFRKLLKVFYKLRYDEANSLLEYNKKIKSGEICFDEYKKFEDIINEYKKHYGKDEKYAIRKLKRDLNGDWFEYGVFRYLNQLKQQGDIDEVVNSLRRKKSSEEDDELEIDLVVLKDYRIYMISLTTSNQKKLSEEKLYEVKLRAEQFAGTEVNIGLISFADNRESLISKIKNIWDTDDRRYFVCTWDELKTLEEDLKKWICDGGNSNE